MRLCAPNRHTIGVIIAGTALPAARERHYLNGRIKMLTPDEYMKTIDLCERVVDAHYADDGGPTVAGSLLGQLHTILSEESSDGET